MVALEVYEPLRIDAVMVASPSEMAVKSPVELIVATAVLSDDQLTGSLA